jgi:hypothetical protein
MHHSNPPELFESEQLEMQLELEDWTVDEVETAAQDWRRRADAAGVSPERRATFGLRILSALMKSPLLDASDTHAKLAAWCRGAGIQLEDVQQALEATWSRRAKG